MKTYQLHFVIKKKTVLQIGKLGKFSFPAGNYVYTGSAKKNIDARIKRHLLKTKKLRWHIDYLLTDPQAEITHVTFSQKDECALNQSTHGNVAVKGFGSSDCKQGCGGHLKLMET